MLNKELHIKPRYLFITRPWFYSIWFAIAIVSYFKFDKAIAWFMHSSVTRPISVISDLITQLGSSDYIMAVVFLAVLIAKFILKKNELSRALLFILFSVVAAGLACDLLKFIFGRARPIELFNDSLYGFCFFKTQYAFISFPSGHSTAIASLGTALSLVWPRYRYLFLLLIILVGLSRLILTAHYLSDVMTGFYLGALTAVLMSQYFNRCLHTLNTALIKIRKSVNK